MKNWAGNLGYRAARTEHPSTVAELQALIGAASSVKALGSRHCFNTIADTAGTHVVLDKLADEPEIKAAAGTVRVAGGLSYGVVGAYLQERGYALANLASLPHISVAGAVQTGTHGSGVGNASLAAAVRAVELVRASGEAVRLTADDGGEFRAAVVGLGALGVITHLDLAIEPTYAVRQQVYVRLPWERVLADFDAVASDGYSVSLFTDYTGDAVAQVWRKVRDDTPGAERRADFHGAPAATAAMHPLPGMSADNCTAQLDVPGPWLDRLPHFRLEFTPSNGAELQTEYLLPRGHAAAALRELRALAPVLAPKLLVSEVRTVAADDFWLSPSFGRDSVALHLTWKPLQPQVEAVLPLIEERLAAFGARPHWGKLFAADAAALRPLYPGFDDFRDLAAKHDPTGKFRNPFLDRVLYGA
ncbi:D-arabinono-1,4-lactone oxidase [Specibacter cremeus]|uniref:D-arabinono-1,4-lactone oxidase n=1 Tax=Specibacter cremeus TaxID=1629051 RepID=UPI000F769312|nr:D-arabinono-1,4-lactone oxidase [Specibacter cremeus]